MTIEIHQPALQALIRQHMETGRFKTVEDVLLQALTASPPPQAPSDAPYKPSLTQFLMASPLAGSGLVIERIHDFPRTVEF